MNSPVKKILLFIGEVILATVVWSLLDYIMGEAIDIVNNLLDVIIIGLFCLLIDYIAKNIKGKNKCWRD